MVRANGDLEVVGHQQERNVEMLEKQIVNFIPDLLQSGMKKPEIWQ